MKALDAAQITKAFEHPNLNIYKDPLAFQDFLKQQSYTNTALLLMSSGNYGGLNFDSLKTIII
jgi:UDP-N-acetylmuramate: L-alanyl-gamma-D-glutamyl-meso-diaminopimelate ligase